MRYERSRQYQSGVFHSRVKKQKLAVSWRFESRNCGRTLIKEIVWLYGQTLESHTIDGEWTQRSHTHAHTLFENETERRLYSRERTTSDSDSGARQTATSRSVGGSTADGRDGKTMSVRWGNLLQWRSTSTSVPYAWRIEVPLSLFIPATPASYLFFILPALKTRPVIKFIIIVLPHKGSFIFGNFCQNSK